MPALPPFLHSLVCAALVTLPLAVSAEPEAPMALADALAGSRLSAKASRNGRDQLTVTLSNSAAKPLPVSIPAGLIAASRENGSRVIALRSASVTVPAKGSLEVALPVAALSSGQPAASSTFDLTLDGEPRLAVLLRALADQPDAPRSTMQLAILCLLEDVTFPQWRRFLGTATEPQPTPAEVTQAIDALGLLRAVAPEQTFALANDDELKRRALRNPWSRAKAMLVYRLDLGDGAVPPDLRQLLHTAPGDNCPICRQRGLMQGPANAP